MVALLLLSWQAAPVAQSGRWPEFRGPTGQGHAGEADLPLEWSESRNVRWKVPVAGRGWSSPVVEGDRVWLTTAVSTRNGTSLRALAYDVQSGREVVNVEVFHFRQTDLLNPKNSHASPTPIVEGDRVYVHFGAGGTAALTSNGEIVWTTRLSYQSQHGNGGSPVLYKDLLIVSCDGSDEAYVIALDKTTGRTRWKRARRYPFDQAYSTPLIIRVGDRVLVVWVGDYCDVE
jgi:outer membrane protein assembly factor BamB